MPHNTTKPIVLICGSGSIKNLQLDRYVRPQSCGAVVQGADTMIDIILDSWNKSNKIENVIYQPNYKVYKKDASIVRDKEMVDFCDVVIAFWNGENDNISSIIDYAKSIGRKVIVHLIKEYD